MKNEAKNYKPRLNNDRLFMECIKTIEFGRLVVDVATVDGK